MPTWRYQAIDRAGAKQSGQVEAGGRALALDAIISQNLTPLDLSLSTEKAAVGGLASRADRLASLRNLATLLDAKVPAASALHVVQAMGSRSAGRRMSEASETLKSGATLALALERAGLLTSEEAALVSAGEATGRLAQALARLADAQSRAAALRAELTAAAVYPIILIVALIATMSIIFGAVLPALLPTFAERQGELPFATTVLVAIHGLASEWGSLILLVVLVGAAAFYLWSRSASGRRIIHRSLILTPLLAGLPKSVAGASLARTLSMMLDGGLALAPALDRASASIPNLYVRQAAQAAAAKVKQGSRVGAALADSDAFPTVLTELARIGEETGRLGQLCGEAAAILEQTIRTKLARAAALFSPIATLVLGLAVGFVMMGVVGGILAAGAIPS